VVELHKDCKFTLHRSSPFGIFRGSLSFGVKPKEAQKLLPGQTTSDATILQPNSPGRIESHLQRSKSILAYAENLLGLAYSLRSLGEVYAVKNFYDQSLYYLEEALQVATKIGDKQAIAYIKRGIGDTYIWQGNANESIEWLFICIPK